MYFSQTARPARTAYPAGDGADRSSPSGTMDHTLKSLPPPSSAAFEGKV